MDIQVKTAKLNPGANVTMTKEEAADYARERLEAATSVFEISPMTATIVLSTEGSETDPVQKCDIKLVIRNQVINQSAHSRSIKKAIDRAMPELRNQIKRFKTHKLDKGRENARNAKHRANTFGGMPVEPMPNAEEE